MRSKGLLSRRRGVDGRTPAETRAKLRNPTRSHTAPNRVSIRSSSSSTTFSSSDTLTGFVR